jgi:hypothetical protein
MVYAGNDRKDQGEPIRHAYIGQVCWTTLTQPGGLVLIRWVTEDHVVGPYALIQHILDHPYGYRLGMVGWSPLRDLQPCYWPEVGDGP